MAAAKGFIVRLASERQELFQQSFETGHFAEPVREFSHSRNTPLVCFVVSESEVITHLALGRSGSIAGTDLRRLNLENILELHEGVSVDATVNLAPSRVKGKLYEKLSQGGLVPTASFQALVKIVTELAPETLELLSQFGENRALRIESLPKRAKVALAEQKEAVATALTISGIDRRELLGWDVSEAHETSSFLDGLEQARLREDQMVVNDLSSLPGFEAVRQHPHSSVVFENEETKLTVVLANRLPLEQQLGTDLIYFNETFSCFLMVQYKAMEQEANDAVFRIPDDQLTAEIERMNSMLEILNACPLNDEADGYRLSENPFFLKMCPRIEFNLDNVGLVKGMYLPLDYWNLLSEHPSLEGPRGGKRLSYRNVRRYFDNTSFVSLVSGGWVGTNIQQSTLLKDLIRNTIATGRAVVLAVSSSKDDRHRQSSLQSDV